MNTLALLMGANGLLSLIAGIVALFTWIIGPPITQEELERANMRSLSWPTDRREVSR